MNSVEFNSHGWGTRCRCRVPPWKVMEMRGFIKRNDTRSHMKNKRMRVCGILGGGVEGGNRRAAKGQAHGCAC